MQSNSNNLCIVVLGASGDLSKKKTFPALFGLFQRQLLPANFLIIGYSRSILTSNQFQSLISPFLTPHSDTNTTNMANSTAATVTPHSNEKISQFLDKVCYLSGAYDSINDFSKVIDVISEFERNSASSKLNSATDRLFYLALPPTAFIPAAKMVSHFNTVAENGKNLAAFTNVIVEKPFGKDLESFQILDRSLASCFREDQIYRIDHYLGKELVQNIMSLRFANIIFEPVFNSRYISSIQFVFKENIGTEGRGGYFDSFGIIRDIMQNHLLQVLTLIAMEEPVSMSANDVRDEKVKVLKAISPFDLDNLVLGQYTAANGKPGYLDDATVPKDSTTPTFATLVMFVNNRRWNGVPFIMKAGKGLNERKAEVRIQFKDVPDFMFNKDKLQRNELVIRIQPQEAMYLKLLAKTPGLEMDLHQTELDLYYSSRYGSKLDLPEAYERLIKDCINQNQSQFVRNDELEVAWKLFTPLLKAIDAGDGPEIIPYQFGTRGPVESDKLVGKFGFKRDSDYIWRPPNASPLSGRKHLL